MSISNKSLGLFSFLILSLGYYVATSEVRDEEDNVLVLNSENFDQAIADNRYILVNFCKLLFVILERLFYNFFFFFLI